MAQLKSQPMPKPNTESPFQTHNDLSIEFKASQAQTEVQMKSENKL